MIAGPKRETRLTVLTSGNGTMSSGETDGTNDDGGSNSNLPGMMGTKRRRMRSDGQTVSNGESSGDKKKAGKGGGKNASVKGESGKKGCKNSTIPIFLKKTYEMIDSSDPQILDWSEDGEMFVVKDPERFAEEIVPQYFDHNKFSSFARQLNFYGFRKMQSKPIRIEDFDEDCARHVTFYNEKFKRGRCDLLKEIRRSTKGASAATTLQDHQREVENLKIQVTDLEQQLDQMKEDNQERFKSLELSFLARMEQMMLVVQNAGLLANGNTGLLANGNYPSGNPNIRNVRASSFGSVPSGISLPGPPASMNRNVSFQRQFSGVSIQPPELTTLQKDGPWDAMAHPIPPRNELQNQTSSSNMAASSSLGNTSQGSSGVTTVPRSGPTLPPHPKQKQLSGPNLPPFIGQPPSRANSMRGVSTMSFRGISSESSASAVLLRNSWEDKFFSMLMLGEGDGRAGGNGNVSTGIQQHLLEQQQRGDGLNSLNNGPMPNASIQAAVNAAHTQLAINIEQQQYIQQQQQYQQQQYQQQGQLTAAEAATTANSVAGLVAAEGATATTTVAVAEATSSPPTTTI
eukprot:scaffold27876_cov51-Attheya_sp.AAC.2